MRIKEEEEKEGQECCNKLEFLLHNKQTKKGFDRLISLSLSFSLSFCGSLAHHVLHLFLVFFPLSRGVKTTLLYFMKVNPFLLSFFSLSSLFFIFSPRDSQHTQHVNGEEKESFRRF